MIDAPHSHPTPSVRSDAARENRNTTCFSRVAGSRPLGNPGVSYRIRRTADVSERGVNLGWKEVRLPAPVFAGDTIRAETEVLETREPESRPGQGIVTVRTRGLNQRDKTVIEFERSIMLPL